MIVACRALGCVADKLLGDRGLIEVDALDRDAVVALLEEEQGAHAAAEAPPRRRDPAQLALVGPEQVELQITASSA
jgi:hypothetical protein